MIDTASGTVTATIAISPDGRTVHVAENTAPGRVAVVPVDSA